MMYKMYLSTLSVLTILAAILSPSQAADTDDWGAWKSQHGKRFESERAEREHRANWKNNAGIVKEHNARSDVSFRMELNYLADKKISRPTFSLDNPQSVPLYFRATSPVPDTWDWRTKGAIGPVHNQGQLGDALSFVVTECVESFHFIQTGRLVSLSEMETHDCCVQRPIVSADTFDCIHGIGGLCSSADYPKSVGKCMNASCSAVAEIGGGKVVARGDEEALKEAVYQLPVLVLIDASHVSFQLYRSGVYSEPQCSSSKLDHALQVVGYGSKNGQDYWICRNSWGTSWGMNGYVLIARNKGNMCGIATMAMYPA